MAAKKVMLQSASGSYCANPAVLTKHNMLKVKDIA